MVHAVRSKRRDGRARLELRDLPRQLGAGGPPRRPPGHRARAHRPTTDRTDRTRTREALAGPLRLGEQRRVPRGGGRPRSSLRSATDRRPQTPVPGAVPQRGPRRLDRPGHGRSAARTRRAPSSHLDDPRLGRRVGRPAPRRAVRAPGRAGVGRPVRRDALGQRGAVAIAGVADRSGRPPARRDRHRVRDRGRGRGEGGAPGRRAPPRAAQRRVPPHAALRDALGLAGGGRRARRGPAPGAGRLHRPEQGLRDPRGRSAVRRRGGGRRRTRPHRRGARVRDPCRARRSRRPGRGHPADAGLRPRRDGPERPQGARGALRPAAGDRGLPPDPGGRFRPIRCPRGQRP